MQLSIKLGYKGILLHTLGAAKEFAGIMEIYYGKANKILEKIWGILNQKDYCYK